MSVTLLLRNSELAMVADAICRGLATPDQMKAIGEANVVACKTDNGRMHYRAASIEMPTVVEREDAGPSRKRRWVASDESVDRMGDIIRVKGWRFHNFKNNPQACWAHDTYALPIGLVSDWEKVTEPKPRLLESITYHTPDLNPFSETLLKLVDARAIRAVSVGFIPIDARRPTEEEREEMGMGYWGVEYLEHDQLELSNCTIPANANCLPAKAAGEQRRAIVKATRELVDTGKLDEAVAREFLGALTLSRKRLFPVKQIVERGEPAPEAAPAPAPAATPAPDLVARLAAVESKLDALVLLQERQLALQERAIVAQVATEALLKNTQAPTPAVTEPVTPASALDGLFRSFQDDFSKGLRSILNPNTTNPGS